MCVCVSVCVFILLCVCVGGFIGLHEHVFQGRVSVCVDCGKVPDVSLRVDGRLAKEGGGCLRGAGAPGLCTIRSRARPFSILCEGEGDVGVCVCAQRAVPFSACLRIQKRKKNPKRDEKMKSPPQSENTYYSNYETTRK